MTLLCELDKLALVCVVTLLVSARVAVAEPVTITLAVVGTAVAASVGFVGYDYFKCRLFECCGEVWDKGNITGLQQSLQNRLHGQHLVIDTVVRSIKGHMNNPEPEKALVLSFHGWTGGGKNFVSRIIAEHIFKQGMESRFVHLFVSTLHFPHKSHIETYKKQLKDWIRGNVSQCGRAMFIFDEMDKMPRGLIDTIKPYIDHYRKIKGVNHRKSIFLFLSNTGGNKVTQHALAHWESGKQREELTLKEMEEILLLRAFNEEGGLWHSSLIEKNLISAFIPFLPLERKHVKMCIKDNLKAKNHSVSEEIVSKIADELQYFPKDKKLYSTSGCKRVSEKVDLVIEEDNGH